MCGAGRRRICTEDGAEPRRRENFVLLPWEKPMSESIQTLTVRDLQRALAVRDLTDPNGGPHAMQLLVDGAIAALQCRWGCSVIVERRSPIVSIADNYDRLHYPSDGAARAARYTRYVCESALLRTQTSAMIPPLLRRLAAEPTEDALLVCPGLVYRRDCIDRLHSAEPHQLDLWRLTCGPSLRAKDLREMVALVVEALLPGRTLQLSAAEHPYTQEGLQIDVREGSQWIEIGECGLALPELLAENGHAGASGLALGLGLDRILMLRKGIDDIRLLREADPRVAAQLYDLSPYRAVSAMPAVQRDLSLAVAEDTTAEQLGDAVRAALGEEVSVVEAVEVLSETAHPQLPAAARLRLGMREGQKNVLLRVVLRALDRSLTHAECNRLRDRIYQALHRGDAWQWAARA
jgi:phenylalanyl-tRNA synthetase alpha chain